MSFKVGDEVVLLRRNYSLHNDRTYEEDGTVTVECVTTHQVVADGRRFDRHTGLARDCGDRIAHREDAPKIMLVLRIRTLRYKLDGLSLSAVEQIEAIIKADKDHAACDPGGDGGGDGRG